MSVHREPSRMLILRPHPWTYRAALAREAELSCGGAPAAALERLLPSEPGWVRRMAGRLALRLGVRRVPANRSARPEPRR